MKKILSMTLALLMVITAIITCAPVSAIAADGDATVIAPDTTWYDASKTSFDISTAAQWYGLAKLISEETTAGSVTSGKTFNLVADIDLNPGWNAAVTVTRKSDDKDYATAPATPANAANVVRFETFAGTINGNGHTLSGFYYMETITEAGTYGGMFKVLKGNVNNLIIENSFIGTKGNIKNAILVGFAQDFQKGLVENVYVDIDIWQTNNYEGGTTSWLVGLIGTRTAGGNAGTNGSNLSHLKNVVFAGTLGKYKSGGLITGNAGSTQAIQLIYDYNWKTTFRLDHVVAAGTVHMGNPAKETKSYAFSHTKVDTADAAFPDGYACFKDKVVYGKYETYEAAQAGTIFNNENVDRPANFSYYKADGAILPTSVVAMLKARDVSVQKTAEVNGKVSVRILGTLDDLEWNRVGFRATMTYNGVTKNADALLDNDGIITTDVVWTSVQAAGSKVTAEALGGNYIYGLVVENVPATGVVFNVSAYYVDANGNEYDLGNFATINVEDIPAPEAAA